MKSKEAFGCRWVVRRIGQLIQSMTKVVRVRIK